MRASGSVNFPFELGVDYGIARSGSKKFSRKRLLVTAAPSSHSLWGVDLARVVVTVEPTHVNAVDLSAG
jgi:hypothetical protein